MKLCPLCGGMIGDGKTTVTVDTGEGVIVVRNVSARICAQCGEDWIPDAIAQEVERVVGEARQKHAEVEVVALAS